MRQTLTNPQRPAIVPRPRNMNVRSLLAVACIAILGLTIAMVLLAANRNLTLLASQARMRLPAHSWQTREPGLTTAGAAKQRSSRCWRSRELALITAA